MGVFRGEDMKEERPDVVTITELNPVWAKISHPKLIDGWLRYRKEWWQQGAYHKVRREAMMRLVGNDGIFLAGFISRVMNYLEAKGIVVDLTQNIITKALKVGVLEGIVYREDQKRALEEIVLATRGVYEAPTGSGKTLLIAGVIASFDLDTLVIVHTTSLFKQTVEELSQWNAKVGRLGAGEDRVEKVTVAMRQTLARGIDNGIFGEAFLQRWGAVIVDEGHHVSSMTGDYATILRGIKAPVRLAFTATVPKAEEAKMALEGLIGPMIGKTSYKELEEVDVLAKPRLKFYRVPENIKYEKEKGGYGQVYQVVVVKNRRRNMLIVEKATEQVKLGRTVLILVEKIEHGEELMELLSIASPGMFVFLHGNTSEEQRAEEKRAFSDKVRKGVVATRIWAEGVNIRSVDVVVNAVGGDSEIGAIQRFGRGMRKADGKDEVLLIDFIDWNHRYVMKHTLKRICYYSEAGWM